MTVGICCYGGDEHAPTCPLLDLPEVISSADAAAALVELAKVYDDGRPPARAWSRAIDRAAEIGRRIEAQGGTTR